MAALLRHGARRIGGSVVQRTKAAFTTPAAREQRRLVTTEHKVRRAPKTLQEVPAIIRERKEELFDQLALLESSGRNNYRNRELLKVLSVHVKPRPDDSMWRRARASKRMIDVARRTFFVMACTLSYTVWSSMVEGRDMTQTVKKKVQ